MEIMGNAFMDKRDLIIALNNHYRRGVNSYASEYMVDSWIKKLRDDYDIFYTPFMEVPEKEKTIGEVIDEMGSDQQKILYFLVGKAIEEKNDEVEKLREQLKDAKASFDVTATNHTKFRTNVCRALEIPTCVTDLYIYKVITALIDKEKRFDELQSLLQKIDEFKN